MYLYRIVINITLFIMEVSRFVKIGKSVCLLMIANICFGCHDLYEQIDMWHSCRMTLSGIPKDYRGEMEKVLKHYENDVDIQKYKAAIFLISNMPGHESYTGPILDEYNCKLDSVINSIPITDGNHDIRRLSDAVMQLEKYYPSSRFEIKEDYEILTSDFLIRNIDEAFELWKNGNWARHLDFDDFCEFILPY